MPPYESSGTVIAIGYASCTGDTEGVEELEIYVMLEWWSGSSWIPQSNADARIVGPPWAVSQFTSHWCTVGTTHSWLTYIIMYVEYEGVLYASPAEIPSGNIYCS